MHILAWRCLGVFRCAGLEDALKQTWADLEGQLNEAQKRGEATRLRAKKSMIGLARFRACTIWGVELPVLQKLDVRAQNFEVLASGESVANCGPIWRHPLSRKSTWVPKRDNG